MDWLNVGRFLIDNGRPNEPFLPDPLWRELIFPSLDPQQRRNGAYGFHVRHDVLDRAGQAMQGAFAYLAGHDGQTLYLLPQDDAVVVRFGAHAQLLHSTIYELFPDG